MYFICLWLRGCGERQEEGVWFCVCDHQSISEHEMYCFKCLVVD